MALEDYKVLSCSRIEIQDFIEKNHYSRSINGCISNYCFKLINPQGVLVGALFYGKMAMRNQYKKYSENENEVIELRRLCCINDTPKNAESFFIGATIRWLRKYAKHLKIIVSYSDLEYGHEGIIYKASNFTKVGFSKGAKVIVYNGRCYHDKTIRTKYKGELKPFAKKIKEALEKGEAYLKNTKGKNIWVYSLVTVKTVNKNRTYKR